MAKPMAPQMADKTDKNTPISAGQLLAKARKQEQRSVQDVAQELHLDEWIVEALEADNFGEIGAPVFVKGHMRKYAELMEISQDDVIAAYYRSEKAPATPPLVAASASRRKMPVISSGMMMVVVVFAVMSLLLVWWFRRDEPSVPRAAETVSLSPETSTPLPGDDSPAAEVVETDPITTTAAPVTQTPEPVAQRETPVQQTTPEVVEAPPGELVFSMSFDEDSWVEIRDARGRRLFFGMARSGTSPSVNGVPPLDVLIGNTTGVNLSVNGARYPIPSGSRRGRTARFQVEQ